MAKKLKSIPTDLMAHRRKLGLNQAQFWSRFGTTQSGGSSYESGRGMPEPFKLLMRLHLNGVITDEDLKSAKG